MGHSNFAPSSMFRTVACFGWLQMSEGIEDEDTEASREGEATHWIAESILKAFIEHGYEYVVHNEYFINKPAPNGVICTDEMFEAAEMYVDYVMEIAPLADLHVEEKLTMPEIHADCWGTEDTFYFDMANRHLHVWDLKYGHRGVHAFENWQLMCYALGALRVVTKGKPLGEHGIKVTLHVVQPRAYDSYGPHREWTLNAEMLRGYVNIMNYACAMTTTTDVECKSGLHCRDCPAAGVCPSLQQSGAAAVEISQASTPHVITDQNLAYELDVVTDAFEMLKFRKEALETDAEKRIREGSRLVGWNLDQNFGNQAWIDDKENIRLTCELMGVDISKPADIKTPTQSLALLKKKGVDTSVISHYYARKPSSLKLKRDDGIKAKLAFQQL